MEANQSILIGSLALDPDKVNGLMEQLVERTVLKLALDKSDREHRHKQVLYSVEGLQKQLERLGNDRDLLSQTLEAQKMLTPQFYDHQIIEPMVRSLFPVVDMVHDLLRESGPPRLTDMVKGLNTQLGQFLATFEIEIYSHQTEQPFDPKCMKPLKQITTYDPQLYGLIAESLQCGFRSPERILRLESVSIYQPPQKGTSNGNPRN